MTSALLSQPPPYLLHTRSNTLLHTSQLIIDLLELGSEHLQKSRTARNNAVSSCDRSDRPAQGM